MKYRWVLVGLLFLLLVGCRAKPEATPLPMVTSMATPTITPIATLRIPGTQTNIPTETSAPTPLPTATAIPYPTSTPPPFPTPEGGYVFPGVESISPNGNWIAWWIDCREQTNNPYNNCLEFIDKDGTIKWTVSDFGVVANDKYPNYTHVAHWSSNNRFAYLVSYRMDVSWIFRPAANSIVKYSLINGTSTYILTPRDDPSSSSEYFMYSYWFSNDSQWLVYEETNGRSVDFTLMNLFTGNVRYFSVIVEDETVVGDISWAPNNQFFVFSAAENIFAIGETVDFSVFRVDVDDLSIKRGYAHGDIFLTFPKWVSNSEVRYENWFGNQYAILNIDTGEMTVVEP